MKTRENTTVRKRRGLFSCFFIILIILFLIVAAVMFAINWYNDAIYSTGTSTQVVEVTVNEGDTLINIADQLEEKELIKSKDALRIYIRLNNIDANVKPGSYSIPKSYSITQIIETLEKGVFRPAVWITLKEGLSNQQIADSLDSALNSGGEKKRFEKEEFIGLVNVPSSTTFTAEIETFLTSVKPFNKPLTGFLFPDTYQIDIEADAKAVLEILLLNFIKRMDDNQIPYNQIPANTGGLVDFYSVLTLASIVEKEASGKDDPAKIAGVFHNRLRDNHPLQSDATVNFITGKNDPGATYADIQIDDPYNTYIYAGLTPTPINNPGIRSIKGAMSPENTDYFYFRHDKQGNSYFSRTFEEHVNSINRYP